MIREPAFGRGDPVRMARLGALARRSAGDALPRAESKAAPSVPDIEAEDALDYLDTLVDGFAFETPLDRSVALAALVTASVRPRLRAAPLFILSTRRLAEIAAALSGRPLATIALSGAAPNADLQIRGALNDHPPVLLMDCSWWTGSPLGGAHLAAALAGEIVARVPGTARVEPVRTSVFAVGTVPAIERAIAEATFEIRMSDPGFDPTARATKHRDLYREAAEAIAGPGEDWSAAVRAPLVALGLPDPAEALGRFPVRRTESTARHVLAKEIAP